MSLKLHHTAKNLVYFTFQLGKSVDDIIGLDSSDEFRIHLSMMYMILGFIFCFLVFGPLEL